MKQFLILSTLIAMFAFIGCADPAVVNYNEAQEVNKEYNVVFDSNGGSGTMNTVSVRAGASIVLPENLFSFPGRNFIGWARTANSEVIYKDADIFQGLDSDITLYAIWEELDKSEIIYQIKFSSNLDDSWNVANPKSIEVSYNESLTLPHLQDIDGQYYFKGWNTKSDGTGENYFYNCEVKNLVSGDRSVVYLYARWSREGEYIINYVLDGGTNNSGNQFSFYKENSVKLHAPSHPDKNYSFAGWYEDESFSGDSITGWNANGKQTDVTLYAKWDRPTCKVTLMSKVDDENIVSISMDAQYNSDMPEIVIPYRDADYSFGGYFTEENGYGKQYYTADGESTGVYDRTEDLTLYAYWIKKKYQYQVTFLAGDDETSNVGAKITVTYGRVMPDVESFSSRDEGYIFAGFFTEEYCRGEQYYNEDGKAVEDGEPRIYDLKRDLTLYAGWKLKTRTMTFNANGGILTDNSTEIVKYNDKASEPTEPIRIGYKFTGWYTSTDEGLTLSDTAYDFETLIVEDISLYAGWTEVYTITYVLDKGTNDTSNPTSYTVETETITLADATKEDYTFEGWYTDENCIDRIMQIEQDSTGDITLYAGWGIKENFIHVQRAAIGHAVTGSSIFTGTPIIISDFYISDHEVTQAEYQKYCNYSDLKPDNNYGGGINYPAYYVSWYDALVYCNKRSIAEDLTPCYTINNSTNPDDWGEIPTSNSDIWNDVTCDFTADGYRLPTETEWEYAARGGNGLADEQYEYAGSNKINDVAWYDDNSDSKTHEIKSKKPNGLGLYDMSGNVWEWCWNWVETVGSPYMRGGSWNNSAHHATVSYRSQNKACNRITSRGFRLVRTAETTSLVGCIAYSDGSVSDTYDSTKTLIGIVIEDKDGVATKIVSLTEANSTEWSTENVVTDAISETDGKANLTAIQSIDGWEEKYPAFKWCDDYTDASDNSEWYLPAKDELNQLYEVKNYVNATIDKIINGGGIATKLKNSYLFYWSSSQGEAINSAWLQRFEDGVQYDYYGKNITYSVRAVRAF